MQRHTHLLALGGVGLSVDFEVRELVTVVIIHPFTEMVANIESPVRKTKMKQ